ncbi:sialate O-acetylesterase [Pedobacter arcticus]|uniref:sialate O-acetylesterase n=1 Tax=Pedobacter arcticus TaxID=752140 RepID=UPI00031658DE|nr:sialate O-acetylesterase [Pedobacter arcticus]
MKIIRTTIFLSLIILLISQSFAESKDSLMLSSVLQSNMVLQQNKPFKIWGSSSPNTEIYIQADWMQHPLSVTSSTNGDFLAIINIPKAKKGDFTKHSVTVSSAKNTIKLNNLLIGDLWLCSGQSNMQFSVKEMKGADEEISFANQPNIRLLNVALNFSAQPINTIDGKWVECSPETAQKFSAVGYSFGKELYESLNIPIGLIFSGIGASGVQAYIPQDVLENDTLLNSVYLQPYLQSPKSKEKIDGGFSFEKVMRPSLLYNAMINPLVNLSIRGICWYQGEANHAERKSYTMATQEMIKSWRERFGQGELPFYYVQIAPYGHEKENPALAKDAFFREAQAKISALNNTEMVTTIDVGDAKDLHPKNKKPVGIRLAKTALNRIYGHLDVVFKGPEFNYVEFKKKQAIIHFKPETLGSGLNTNDGAAPLFFFIAGSDQIFYPAQAEIIENVVKLKSTKVKQPVSVRYAFFNYPVTNLQNREGFPVVPFRTDNWQEATY